MLSKIIFSTYTYRHRKTHYGVISIFFLPYDYHKIKEFRIQRSPLILLWLYKIKTLFIEGQINYLQK